MFIVTKEIDSENISKLCRTCLREDGDKMVCLFVGPAGSSLAAKLRSLSCLDVWQGDGLPEKMCDRCVTRAESALLYREQCRAADRALRQAASKVLTKSKYQQSEAFTPLQNSHKGLKCTECGAAFKNYQELCVHNRLHLPLIQDTIPVQHMHIVESQNAYFNFSHFGSNFSHEVSQSAQITPFRSNMMHMMPINNENSNRAACALHCSLCNHTFTNRMQLISHNITHSNDNIDLSSDTENINISEISDQIPRDLSYDRSMEQLTDNSIQNLSYQRTGEGNEEIQNLTFPDNIELHNVPENNSERVQNTILQSNNEDLIIQNIRFPKIPNQETNRVTDSTFSNCVSDSKFEDQRSMKVTSFIEEKKYVCEICRKSFNQKSKLISHQSTHTNERPFKCNHCSKSYASKSKLNAHSRLHTKTNIHCCEICDKVFVYPSYLEEHMKTHNKINLMDTTSEKRFECSVCKKQFRLMKNLKYHEKLHTGKGLLQCEICDKQFSQRYNLKIHLRTHRTLKTHICSYCDKSFAQKGNLVEHLRIHTKVKPFQCKVCQKKFSQSSHLKNHEASHTSLRQHQCRLCGKRFKLANHLKRHLNLHTGTKTYKCDQCSQMFAQSYSLKRHLKRHNESQT